MRGLTFDIRHLNGSFDKKDDGNRNGRINEI